MPNNSGNAGMKSLDMSSTDSSGGRDAASDHTRYRKLTPEEISALQRNKREATQRLRELREEEQRFRRGR